ALCPAERSKAGLTGTVTRFPACWCRRVTEFFGANRPRKIRGEIRGLSAPIGDFWLSFVHFPRWRGDERQRRKALFFKDVMDRSGGVRSLVHYFSQERDDHFIKIPARVSFRPDRPQVLGNQRSEFEHPPAD